MQDERSISSATVARNAVAKHAWGLVAVSFATLLLGFLAGRALGVTHVRYAIAVPAGILLGPAGAAGFAFGGFCQRLLVDSPVLPAVVRAAGDIVLVTIGFAVWDWQSPLRVRSVVLRVVWTLATYILAVLVGTVLSVAVVAIGLEILNRATVVSVLPVLATDRLTGGLVAGPILMIGAAVWRGGEPRHERRDGPTTQTVVGVLAVAVIWLTGSYAASLVRRDTMAFPATRQNVFGTIPDLVEIFVVVAFGGLYRPLLVVNGMFATGVILALFTRDDYRLLSRTVGENCLY